MSAYPSSRKVRPEPTIPHEVDVRNTDAVTRATRLFIYFCQVHKLWKHVEYGAEVDKLVYFLAPRVQAQLEADERAGCANNGAGVKMFEVGFERFLALIPKLAGEKVWKCDFETDSEGRVVWMRLDHYDPAIAA